MDYLPGTTVEVNENNTAQGFLDSAFALNGLVLSQIVQLTGLEPHTVQNWVKRRFVGPPVQKKYDCNQFCRIAIINMLKDIFQIEKIVSMLKYVEEEDKDATDILVYIVFSELLAMLPPDAISAQTDIDELVGEAVEKRPIGMTAKVRLAEVLKVMLLAYLSANIKRRAEQKLAELDL